MSEQAISVAKATGFLRAYANHRLVQLNSTVKMLEDAKSCLDALPNSEEKSELLKDVARRLSDSNTSRDTATTRLLVRYVNSLPVPAGEDAPVFEAPVAATEAPTAAAEALTTDDDVEIEETVRPGDNADGI